MKRVFFSMNYMNNKLRNKNIRGYLNDYLAPFIEREFFLQAEDIDGTNCLQATNKHKINVRL